MTTESAQVVGGSFRDPAGKVFQANQRIYRTVNPVAAAAYEKCRDNKGLKALRERGWVIDGTEVPESEWAALGVFDLFEQRPVYVLEHARVPFISYPYEWTFQQLKDAALRHLEIQIEALDNDVVLSDASAFNMQFVGGRAVHIDMLSFRPYQEGEIWVGYDQFCRHFLYPLLIEHYTGVAFNQFLQASIDGVHINDVYRLIPPRYRYTSLRYLLHVVMRYRAEHKTHRLDEIESIVSRQLPPKRLKALFQDMHAWIGSLSSRATDSYWQDYAGLNSYQAQEKGEKEAFIAEFVQRASPESLIDLGGNTGDYSRVALSHGVKRAVVVDADLGALGHCYQESLKTKAEITTVYTSLTDPSAARGWNESERMGFNERAQADAMLALALVHHLVITGGIPFGQVLNWLVDRAPCGVIEFVPKSDSMVKRMLATREDIFPDYSVEYMRQTLSQRSNITRELHLETSGRILFEYQSQ